MSTRMRGLGQILTVVAFVAALLLGAMPAAPTAAQPVSDVRDVKVKVRDLKLDCQSMDGSATSRPSAMDDDKYIVSCTGGGLDGLTCVYTPTTSDCSVDKQDPTQPGDVPQADDDLGLAPVVTGAANGAAAAATQAAPAKEKHGKKHGKHGKKGGKHRRR